MTRLIIQSSAAPSRASGAALKQFLIQEEIYG